MVVQRIGMLGAGVRKMNLFTSAVNVDAPLVE
jgi:hypothetical protein